MNTSLVPSCCPFINSSKYNSRSLVFTRITFLLLLTRLYRQAPSPILFYIHCVLALFKILIGALPLSLYIYIYCCMFTINLTFQRYAPDNVDLINGSLPKQLSSPQSSGCHGSHILTNPSSVSLRLLKML